MAIPADTVGIGRVAVTGLSAQVWMDKDGAINLERLFAGFTQEEDAGAADQEAVSTVPTDSNPPQAASSAENDWTVKLAAVELEGASIEFEDRSITPAAKFELAPVQVKITDLTLDQTRPVPVTLNATLDDTTSIKAEGTLIPEPFAAELDVALDELDLRKFQSYVGQATAMTIRRGQARATGRFSISPPSGKKPELAFAGDVRVTGFRSTDDALNDDFVKFERLDLRKVRFAMEPDSLSIERVDVRKPYARVSISPDQVLNVAAVFDPEGTAAALAERKAKAADTRRQPKARRRSASHAARARRSRRRSPPRRRHARSSWRPAGRYASVRCGSSPAR